MLTNQHPLSQDISFNDSSHKDHVDNYNDDISNYNKEIEGVDVITNDFNAVNKSTPKKLNNLSETSLVNTTVVDQLRQCNTVPSHLNTSEQNTLNTSLQDSMNLFATSLLIPTIDEQLLQCRIEKHNDYRTQILLNNNYDNALNDISRSTAVNERSVISNSANENNVRNAEDIIIQYNELNTIYQNTIDNNALWKQGTTLIIGDSILYGIDESKLKHTKVRVFPGSSIEDIFFNITPLLRKKPSNIILHIGTNNAVYDNSSQIIEKIIKLKEYIISKLPECKLFFSSLIERFDDAKAQLTVLMTNKKLAHLGMGIINNNNIKQLHLGKKRLHLNPHGTGKLALNFLKILKTL